MSVFRVRVNRVRTNLFAAHDGRTLRMSPGCGAAVAGRVGSGAVGGRCTRRSWRGRRRSARPDGAGRGGGWVGGRRHAGSPPSRPPPRAWVRPGPARAPRLHLSHFTCHQHPSPCKCHQHPSHWSPACRIPGPALRRLGASAGGPAPRSQIRVKALARLEVRPGRPCRGSVGAGRELLLIHGLSPGRAAGPDSAMTAGAAGLETAGARWGRFRA